jgi:hypothetical protein
MAKDKELYVGEKDFKKKGVKQPNLYSEKDQKFYLRMCKYIWSQYVRNYSTISYGGYSSATGKSFVELRLYGLGQQDRLRYAELLGDCDPLTGEGWMNINWDIVQILPKFRDIVKGKLAGMDFEVNTQALDELSVKKRLRKSNKMKLLMNPAIKMFMEKTGQAPPDIELPEYIQTAEDLDVYIKMGGVRLDYELAMRDAIESTKYESNWGVIKDKVVEDIIDLGVCAVKTKVHPKTNKVMADYVDPMYLVIQPSKYEDHRNSTWAGEIRTLTIGELRMESNLTEGQLLEIAKKYRGKRGNPSQFEIPSGIEWQKTYRTDYDWDTTEVAYNDFSVDILESYFIAKDVERYIVGVREDEGNYIYDKVSRKTRLNKGQKKKGKSLEDNVIEKCYTACWVIGTNFTYDCGEEYAIAKENKDGVKKALLPITVFSNKSKSIVERCISFVDDIQLATLKKRNAIAKMAPGPRMVIDKSLLRDAVQIGDQKYSMLDMMELYVKSGIMIVESVAEYDADEGGSNRPPIQYNPTGIVEDINIFLQEIGHNIDQIRHVTGVNEVADGSTQKGDMLVRVMEGLNAATNNALRPHFRLYEGLFENWCKYAVLKWQVALMGGEIDVNYVPIGDTTIRTISLSKDLYMNDFGIQLTLLPSKEDQQMLLGNLEGMKNADQVAIEDYFILYNMVRSGDVKKAQFYLSKAVKNWRKIRHQQEMEKMQQQGQANGEAAVMAEQARLQTAQAKLQGDLAKIAAQGQEDRKTLELEYQLKMEENKRNAGQKLGADIATKAVDTALTQQQGLADQQEGNV